MWGQANQHHLASVTNMKLHSHIQSKVIIGNKKTYFWIGVTDQEQEGDGRWTNESPWKLTMWGPRQPDEYKNDEDCLQINLGWALKDGWNDNRCTTHIKFVCSQRLCPDNDTNIREAVKNYLADFSAKGGRGTPPFRYFGRNDLH